METPTRKCIKCGRCSDRITKQMCFNCYRRFAWKRKLVECKRCKRMLPHHSKGLCGGCYNTTFFLQRIKDSKNQRYQNIKQSLLLQDTLAYNSESLIQLHFVFAFLLQSPLELKVIHPSYLQLLQNIHSDIQNRLYLLA